MFPIRSWFSLREIAAKRRDVIVDSALKSPVLARVIDAPKPQPVAPKEPVKEAKILKGQAEVRRINEQRLRGPNRHSPTRHIRTWAKEHGYKVGDRARLPDKVISDYEAAHAPDAEAGGDP
jgi:hypothetical protein